MRESSLSEYTVLNCELLLIAYRTFCFVIQVIQDKEKICAAWTGQRLLLDNGVPLLNYIISIVVV